MSYLRRIRDVFSPPEPTVIDRTVTIGRHAFRFHETLTTDADYMRYTAWNHEMNILRERAAILGDESVGEEMQERSAA